MRVLVLGGTQFLSRAIVRQAVDRGHEVVSAARGRAGDPEPGATFVQLDRDDPDGFAAVSAVSALSGEYDAVIDVARQPSHVTRALTALAERAAHWTFVSTISVYADDSVPGQTPETGRTHEPLSSDADETDPENYGPAKVSCERLVRDAAGDRAFVLRAGLIVGPGDGSDRFTYWVDRLARGGRVLAPGTPQDPVQHVDVRDLAAWILDASESGSIGTYDGIGPIDTRGQLLADVAAGVGATGDAAPQLVWADQEFLTAQQVEPWMGPRSLPLWLPLPAYAGMLAHDPEPPAAAGLRTRPTADTARDTLAWLRESGHEVSRAGLSADEEAALLGMFT